MHVVAIAVTDRAPIFELSTGIEVFGADRSPYVGVPWYDLRVCAGQDGAVRIGDWALLDTPHGLDDLAAADTVLVPPPCDTADTPPPELLDALRAAHARGARIASICTGAYLLAAAGLLDGRRATVHWNSADDLARRFPAVEVDRSVLYIDDGDILTSAGSAAGLDLCLHLVRSDHGSRVANIVARHVVVPPHRAGGQAQYVDAPVTASPEGGVGAALAWAHERLDRAFTVDEWAAAAAMSPRTFARRFRAATGLTPWQWVLGERVRWARELLEETRMPVDAVAHRCGFATPAGLRRHFARHVRLTPQEYRQTFRSPEPIGA